MRLLRCVCRGVGSTLMEPQGLAGQEPVAQSTWEGKPFAYCQLCSPSPAPSHRVGEWGVAGQPWFSAVCPSVLASCFAW